MNLDEECQAALSRITYAVNANAEYEKIQIAKEFAKLREAKEGPAKKSEDPYKLYNQQQMAQQQMANFNPLQNCDGPIFHHPYYHGQYAAHGALLGLFGGGYQW